MHNNNTAPGGGLTSHPSHPLDPPLHKAAAATTAKQAAAAAAAVGDGGRLDTDTDFIQSACDSSTGGTGYNRGENALNKTRRSAIAPKERAMRRVSVEISPAVAQRCRNYFTTSPERLASRGGNRRTKVDSALARVIRFRSAVRSHYTAKRRV